MHLLWQQSRQPSIHVDRQYTLHSSETAPQFLALKNVACVGGSWLTPADAMKAGDWNLITELAKAAAALGKQA